MNRSKTISRLLCTILLAGILSGCTIGVEHSNVLESYLPSADTTPTDPLPDTTFEFSTPHQQVPSDITTLGMSLNICPQNNQIVAIKEDGTILFAQRSDGYSSGAAFQEELYGWGDIAKIITSGMDDFFGLKADGTIVMTGSATGNYPSISSWTDITDVQSSAYWYPIAGLRSNGTVVLEKSDHDYGKDFTGIEQWGKYKANHL